jgi:uncharacterized protein (DUF427 family)
MIKLSRLDKHPDIQRDLLSSRNIDDRIVINKLNYGISYFHNNTRLFNTHNAMLMFEKDFSPVLYVPKSDIFQRHFLPSKYTSYCPFKGEANYWSLSVKDEIIVDAVWEYASPISKVSVIENHMAFANQHSGGDYLFYKI